MLHTLRDAANKKGYKQFWKGGQILKTAKWWSKNWAAEFQLRLIWPDKVHKPQSDSQRTDHICNRTNNPQVSAVQCWTPASQKPVVPLLRSTHYHLTSLWLNHPRHLHAVPFRAESTSLWAELTLLSSNYHDFWHWVTDPCSLLNFRSFFPRHWEHEQLCRLWLILSGIVRGGRMPRCERCRDSKASPLSPLPRGLTDR